MKRLLFLAAFWLSVPLAAEPGAGLADRVLVDKSERSLRLYRDGALIHEITGLQFGGAPLGHKWFEGDERTPEGRYTIDFGNPQSRYHLSLHVSYPNAADRAQARQAGRAPGGAIFLHGQPNRLPEDRRMVGDWTDGCIALTNAEIRTLWKMIPDGTVLEIRP